MPTPAHIALSRLLPTYSPLPPLLLETADSLLSLSRQRASHLKGDEEIARAHACAEIACSRLRSKLRLPPVKTGTAPATAKVYKKLYVFLEGVLKGDVERSKTTTTTTAARSTPGKRKRAGEGEDIEATPTKKARNTPTTTPSKSTLTRTPSTFIGKIKSASTKPASVEAPDFILPSIRKLCSAFSTPEMTPHVYTGTCVVLKHTNLWPHPAFSSSKPTSSSTFHLSEEEYHLSLLALTVSIYLMVLTRMMHGKISRKIFSIIAVKSGLVLNSWDGPKGEKEIEIWVKRINKERWAKGADWFESTPEGVFSFDVRQAEDAEFGDAENLDGVDGNGDGEDDSVLRRTELNLAPDPEGVLLPGLGTMMQDAIDWTSEQRRHEYEEWKAETLERSHLIQGSKEVEVH